MIESLGGFALVYAAAIAVPGPFVATLLARSVAEGPRTGIPMMFGAALGDVVWGCLALFGLALIAGYMAPVVTFLKYAGAAYIVWIGWSLLTARAAPVEMVEPQPGDAWRAGLSGLTITLGNPKPMTFFLAVLPGLFDLTTLTLAQKVEILMILPPVLLSVLGLYVLLAVRARRMLANAKSVQRINRTAGGAMIAAGAAIAAG